MPQPDRGAPPTSLKVQLGGTVAELRVDAPLVEVTAHAFRDLTAPITTDTSEMLRLRLTLDDGRCTVLEDGNVLGWRDTLDSVLSIAQSRLNTTVVESRETPVTLHAAGVVMNGRTILLAAGSGGGKSTLAASLLPASDAYLGDETISLCGHGADIRGFPKPLMLKSGTLVSHPHLRSKLQHDPTDPHGAIRLVAATALNEQVTPMWEGRADLVLLLDRRDAPEEPVVEAMSPPRALQALSEASFGFEPDPVASLLALTELLRAVPVARLRYREAHQVMEAATSLFGSDLPTPEVARARLLANGTSANSYPARAGGTVGITFASEAVFFQPATRLLIRAQPIAAEVWNHADGATTESELARRAAGTRWPEELARQSLIDLLSIGVLR